MRGAPKGKQKEGHGQRSRIEFVCFAFPLDSIFVAGWGSFPGTYRCFLFHLLFVDNIIQSGEDVT